MTPALLPGLEPEAVGFVLAERRIISVHLARLRRGLPRGTRLPAEGRLVPWRDRPQCLEGSSHGGQA
jgi:hypothetical protein